VAKKVTPSGCYDLMEAVFAALGSPTRLAILARLVAGPACVNAVAEAVGSKQANISQQLVLLKQAGLVTSVRTGGTVTYSTDGPEVDRLIHLTLEILRKVVAQRSV